MTEETARIRRVVENSNGQSNWWQEEAPLQRVEAAEGSIDAVRELIFGRRFQEMQGKVDALEHRLLAESAHIQASMARRLELFEEEVRDALSDWGSRLAAEQAKREATVSDLSSELGQVRASFSQLESDQVRLHSVVEETSKQLAMDITRAFQDCQSDTVERSREMHDEMSSIRSSLVGLIEQAQETSVDRDTLSSIFLDLGNHLAAAPKAEVTVSRVRKAIEKMGTASPRPRKT